MERVLIPTDELSLFRQRREAERIAAIEAERNLLTSQVSYESRRLMSKHKGIDFVDLDRTVLRSEILSKPFPVPKLQRPLALILMLYVDGITYGFEFGFRERTTILYLPEYGPAQIGRRFKRRTHNTLSGVKFRRAPELQEARDYKDLMDQFSGMF